MRLNSLKYRDSDGKTLTQAPVSNFHVPGIMGLRIILRSILTPTIAGQIYDQSFIIMWRKIFR